MHYHLGMRPQEMICIFRIVDSAEAFGPGDRLAADSVSLEIVQCRDISSKCF